MKVKLKSMRMEHHTPPVHPPNLLQIKKTRSSEWRATPKNSNYLARMHAQGVKQLVCLSVVVIVVVVVVGAKIAISHLLGICVCYKHNQLIDTSEKLVYKSYTGCKLIELSIET